ncbi:succinate dehydrogenase assembly factor 2 [Agaribacterium haliotis]|uniref:FAD assembly factor SdhE n=1 Tax=Agaribacterium haliotis TaxID=2013869 RepID=UPI000BB579CA|nr:succinate dehydrogenase assembly factor 2 [Agaribacterium haliotis]
MDLHRLRWAARRGMLELDLVLLPFVENVYTELDTQDQQRFHDLLECEDTELFAWFLGKEEPEDDELKRIVKVILQNTGIRGEQL